MPEQYAVYVFRDVAIASKFTHEMDQEGIACRQKNNTVQVKIASDRSYAFVADDVAAELGGNKVVKRDTSNRPIPGSLMRVPGKQMRLVPRSQSKMYMFVLPDVASAEQFKQQIATKAPKSLTVHAQLLEGTRDQKKYAGVGVEVYCDPGGESIKRALLTLAEQLKGHEGRVRRRDGSSFSMAATRHAPSQHVYDVYWFSEPGVDEQLVYWLRSLGVATKISTSGPLRIGYRLFSKRKMGEVMKVLRRRTHGDVSKTDISIREVE